MQFCHAYKSYNVICREFLGKLQADQIQVAKVHAVCKFCDKTSKFKCMQTNMSSSTHFRTSRLGPTQSSNLDARIDSFFYENAISFNDAASSSLGALANAAKMLP